MSLALLLGEIFAERLFDREEQSSYSLTVAATDNGGRMGFTTVVVNITDVNDVAPEFLHTEYKVSVPMNAGKGRPLIQVQARDSDLGEAGRVTYNIYDASLIISATLFTIDPTSGIVSVKADLSDKGKEDYTVILKKMSFSILQGNAPVDRSLNYFSSYFIFQLVRCTSSLWRLWIMEVLS